MKPASISDIKKELKESSGSRLLELCLSLAKFKKENKELLTYLLFYEHQKAEYVRLVKEEISEGLKEVNTQRLYFGKKTIRKVLRRLKNHIRYTKDKEMEAECLLFFCKELKAKVPGFQKLRVLDNLYNNQLNIAKKAVSQMHEDLQYDFQSAISDCENL